MKFSISVMAIFISAFMQNSTAITTEYTIDHYTTNTDMVDIYEEIVRTSVSDDHIAIISVTNVYLMSTTVPINSDEIHDELPSGYSINAFSFYKPDDTSYNIEWVAVDRKHGIIMLKRHNALITGIIYSVFRNL